MRASEELTDELLRLFNGLASWEGSVIRASELSASEAHAIEALGQYGRMNMKSLAQKLGVTTGTITVTMDRLEAKGYARREPCKEDRRVNLIRLTAKGQQAFAEHRRCHQRFTDKMIAGLAEEEAALLIKLLKKVNAEVF